jgi:hypothetical protein
MSAPVDTMETLTDRSARATSELCEALGLKSIKKRDELSLLSLALAEVATREARADRAFAARIRSAYQELINSRPPTPTKKTKKLDKLEELVPTGPVDLSRLRPGGTIDPFALYQGYGESQTRNVLGGQGLDEITKSAAFVERHKPGTMPKGRKTKKLLVDYIMTQVMEC